MLKIVKSFSKGKLRRNILFITKCDQLFAEAAGHPLICSITYMTASEASAKRNLLQCLFY